ncbi:DoxX family protein [Streptosporangium longisporum]|uniref:DoxX family protein n=1 Tax=Streptosporangium longisporum TaxID=46187 RepID=A0ABP6KHB3_9ACTN
MRRTLHDLASLAARLGVGGIFFANGWHKLEAGLNATAAQFATLEAPGPYVWAAVTMLMELIGGALMVAGLAVSACGLLLFAEALAVFVLASGQVGLPLTGGDAKLIVALGAASILLAVGGAGRLSVDHMVVIKRREAEAAEDFAAEAEADDVIASLREPEPSARPSTQAAPGAPVPGTSGNSGTSGTSGKRPGDGPGPAFPDPAFSDPGSSPAGSVSSGSGASRSTAAKAVPGSGAGSDEGGADTAEFPAARPRTRTRKPPPGATGAAAPAAPAPPPAPGTTGDTLVAGKKDKPAEG